jgi:hypothetical protein
MFFKPISKMPYQEILKLVISSNASDWKHIAYKGNAEYFLMADPRLRFIKGEPHQHMLGVEWTGTHPDSSPSESIYYDLFYCCCVIERSIIMCVDGGKGCVPLPDDPQKREVSSFAHRLAQIIDHTGTADNYMERCQLVIR